MGRFVEGIVVAHKMWAHNLRSLMIEVQIEPFIAGQFTQLSLDADQHLFRPYSFANAPHQLPLEFYYSQLPNGKLTPHLSKLEVGDKVFVAKHAVGRFILSTIANADILWLFATGTGLGVFLSILQTQEPWQRFEKVVLVHSVHKADFLTHQDLIQSWVHHYPGRFHWLPIVTGEQLPGYISKRVTALLRLGELEQLMGLSLAANTSQVMLCGNPAMVKEMVNLLVEKGLALSSVKHPGQITVESYWKM